MTGCPVLCGVGEDGRALPLCNISGGEKIEVIPLITITREGGELKNRGAGGRSRIGGVGGRGQRSPEGRLLDPCC